MTDGAFIRPRDGGGFVVGYWRGDYTGPTAEVYTLTYPRDAKPTWVIISTDDYEGHAMLNIEALPKLRQALAKLAKAIEARSAETGNTDSARRAKARSATPICPNNIAKESEGAE